MTPATPITLIEFILLIVGFCLILAAIALLFSQRRRSSRCYQMCMATITDITKRVSTEIETTSPDIHYGLCLKYTYKDQIFTRWIPTVNPKQYIKGQKLFVQINPENPEDIYNPRENFHKIIALFLVFGNILLFLCLFLRVFPAS